jgi:hypothetical protein
MQRLFSSSFDHVSSDTIVCTQPALPTVRVRSGSSRSHYEPTNEWSVALSSHPSRVRPLPWSRSAQQWPRHVHLGLPPNVRWVSRSDPMSPWGHPLSLSIIRFLVHSLLIISLTRFLLPDVIFRGDSTTSKRIDLIWLGVEIEHCHLEPRGPKYPQLDTNSKPV